jgi:hypothetical protein
MSNNRAKCSELAIFNLLLAILSEKPPEARLITYSDGSSGVRILYNWACFFTSQRRCQTFSTCPGLHFVMPLNPDRKPNQDAKLPDVTLKTGMFSIRKFFPDAGNISPQPQPIAGYF